MIWVGADPAPPFVGEYFQGWKTLMPEWDLRLWTNEDIHSTEFSEDYQRLIDSARQGAQKADIMRYYILWKHGGIYMDADVEPHRSLEPLLATKKRLLLCHDLKDYMALYRHRVYSGPAPSSFDGKHLSENIQHRYYFLHQYMHGNGTPFARRVRLPSASSRRKVCGITQRSVLQE